MCQISACGLTELIDIQIRINYIDMVNLDIPNGI